MFEVILFDLDGTVTDTQEGITKSVVYALKKFGITEEDTKKLTAFIGPPLYESFMVYYGFDRAKAYKAVEYYREYYSVTGLFENAVYAGVEELLTSLKSAGKRIVLATSKPEPFAVKILEQHNLIKYFDHIAGATFDSSRVEKADVIAYALKKAGADGGKCLMVGDRKHDVEGAKQNGIKCAAVLYGFGTKEELLGAGADFIIDTPSALLKIV